MSELASFLKRPDALELVAAAAKATDAAYEAPAQGVEERSVNLYWWRNPTSAQVSRSDLLDGTARHCVAFRGTIMTEAGNWVFANMQAYKTKFQGYPVDGEVHMGFYRAFHWLWLPLEREPKVDDEVHMGFYRAFHWLWSPSHCEPKVDDEHKERRRKVARRRASLLIFILACVWVARVFWNPLSFAPLTDGGRWLAVKLFVTFALLRLVEIGWAEKRFTLREPRPKGIALEDKLTNIDEGDEVVFTGHSLGGAMAVHAFLMFRRLRPNVKSSLITFGAPRAGDQKWVDSVIGLTKGQDQLHIVNNGDPVPEMPGTLAQAKNLKPGAGYLKAVLMVLGVVREVWAHRLLFDQTAPGNWPSRLVHRVGTYPLRLRKHPMAEYGQELQKDLKIPDPTKKRKEPPLAFVGFVATTLLFIILALGLLWGLVCF